MGGWADISANNCIRELCRIIQIEGKIIALKYPGNRSLGNYLESCETCKSMLENISGQERELRIINSLTNLPRLSVMNWDHQCIKKSKKKEPVDIKKE